METINDILGYNLNIYQNSNYFSFSLDSIILANYSTIRLRDKNIVDLCTGNGVVPIILSRRCNSKIIGVEVQKEICDLAVKSVKINHLEDRIDIINEDAKEFANKHLNEFDLVLCNPPYFKNDDKSTKNLCLEKMIARHEVLIDLDGVLSCGKKLLKDNGTFCLVHRTDRLIEVIDAFKKNNIEPKRIKFIYNRVDLPSNLFLIEGQKAGRCGLIVDKPLIMFDNDGNMNYEYKILQEEVNEGTK